MKNTNAKKKEITEKKKRSYAILPSGNVRTKVYIGKEIINGKSKPIYQSFTGKSEEIVEMEIERILKQRKKEMDQQKTIEEQNKNVPYYEKEFEPEVNKWLKLYKKPPVLKIQSYDRLCSTLTVHIFPRFGRYKIGNIDSDMLQGFIMEKADTLSYSSVKKIHDAFSGFFTHCIETNKLKVNPITAVKMPKKEMFKIKTKEIQIIDNENISIVEETAITTYRNGKLIYPQGAGIIVLLNTGMRLGELLALEWDSDIDFGKGEIKVWKTLIFKDLKEDDDTLSEEEYEMLLMGKTQNPIIQEFTKTNNIRTLYMNDKTRMALTILRKYSKKYVIETNTGNIVLPATFARTFKYILNRAGVEETNIHATRHTFATRALENGTPPEVLSKILGHCSTKMVFDTYNHIIEKRKKDAIEAFNRLDK